MNTEWAVEVLEDWIRKAEPLLVSGSTYAQIDRRLEALRTREHPTRVVIQRVLGLDRLPRIITESLEGKSYIGGGIDQAKYALGVLHTEAEIEVNLGPNAPTMSADGLHSIIWDAASKLWDNGHYAQAVQTAATYLNAHVQDITSRHDVSDAALMQQVFSTASAEIGKPRLRWPGENNDLTVKAMRSGILSFAQGCFLAIRNPVAHGTDDIPKQIALEQLATLSTLARWIDGCELDILPPSATLFEPRTKSTS